ncbi:MAG: glycoside hydrolase family 18 protein, partial [Lentisphaerae bacterium]|nr:glycoside hydrolase family 18 protein [Lentisphaerota bacterium]
PVIISLGGWSYTHRFRDMAAWDNYQDGSQMSSLMSDINKLKNQSWFGGVDLDWEYPVRGHASPQYWKKIPQEAGYFKLLIEKLGSAMKGTNNQGRKLYFSIDLPCSNEALDEMFDNTSGLAEAINNNVSFITLMSYDMHGEYEAASGGNALSMSDPDEIEPVVKHLINDLGIKPEKILLGMPNYARQMIVTSDENGGYNQKLLPVEIYQADTSYVDPANIEPYPGVGGMVDNTGVYYNGCLMNKIYGVSTYPDSVEAKPYPGMRDTGGEELPGGLEMQKIPGKNIGWILGPFGSVHKLGMNGALPETFQGYPVFTFDTPETVRYKVENLVKKYGMGGISFWELYGDAWSQNDWQYNNQYSNILAARAALDAQ